MTVNPFMVVADSIEHKRRQRMCDKNFSTDQRVCPHDFILLIREHSRLVQYAIRHTYFSKVMNETTEKSTKDQLLGQPYCLCG